jgi:hypothetical protein
MDLKEKIGTDRIAVEVIPPRPRLLCAFCLFLSLQQNVSRWGAEIEELKSLNPGRARSGQLGNNRPGRQGHGS